MIYEPKESDDDIPALEILDEQGTPLAEGLDFDDIDEKQNKTESLRTEDYEDLN